MKRPLVVFVIALGVVSLGATRQPLGAASVPNPTVTGPIPATVPPGDPSRNYPFFSAPDLASNGYVEEEFFIDGTANRYTTSELETAAIVSSGHPYRTRMVVRRPVSPESFNGTVQMEWQNVTAGYEIDAMWNVSHEHIMRRGYAWVGVSVQQVGIHQPETGLKAWSPTRYGLLDVTQGGTILDDSLCYDIFSQAAQAVRNPVGVDPMGGLRVKRVIATGASQSARRLGLYHNTIHPLAGVFDAFFLAVGGRQLRTDLDVKVFKVLSETDVAGIHAALRQPDSDHLRRWEVAGSAHLDFHLSQHLRALYGRDGTPAQPVTCDLPPFSHIPMHFVANAAMEHLVRWVAHNSQPPHAPDIEVLSVTPESAEIARDRFGNAAGGIRLSQHAVPTATNTGLNSGPGFCRLYGWYQPFDATTLDTLYPDHQTYLSLVMQVTHENMRSSYILPADAGATIEAAAESAIGRPFE